MRYKLFLFDFDLTIADATYGIIKCYKSVMEKYGFSLPEDYAIKRTIGLTLIDSFRILTGENDPARLEILRKEYVLFADVYMTKFTELFPQTERTVRLLREKGCKTGIVTTKFAYRTLDALRKFSIEDCFDVVIGGENVEKPKPEPDGIFAAIAQLSACKADVLYIGDSIVDAEAAQNAGVDFCGVLTGVTTEDELNAFPHAFICENLDEMCIRVAACPKEQK